MPERESSDSVAPTWLNHKPSDASNADEAVSDCSSDVVIIEDIDVDVPPTRRILRTRSMNAPKNTLPKVMKAKRQSVHPKVNVRAKVGSCVLC